MAQVPVFTLQGPSQVPVIALVDSSGNIVTPGTSTVTSVDGQTGAVTLSSTYAPINPTERVNTVAAAGASQTLPDVTTATIHDLTLTAATCALTFPTTAAGKSFTLILRQDSTGGRLVSYPASIVKWPGGSAPTLTTTASVLDVLTFVCANGTNWLGSVSLDVR
jgi:hypothetical protein